jgi:hypothetical protein
MEGRPPAVAALVGADRADVRAGRDVGEGGRLDGLGGAAGMFGNTTLIEASTVALAAGA